LTAPVPRARPFPAALSFILIAFMTTLGSSACGTARHPAPQFRNGRGVQLMTPQIGQAIDMKAPLTTAWWARAD
jgi:hypothetical protein